VLVEVKNIQQKSPLGEDTSYDKVIYKERDNALVIDVETKDTLQLNLRMNDEEVYTWYRVQPKSLLLGTGSDMTLAYLPAIYLPEYVEIWGSRAYDVVSNYVTYTPYVDSKQQERGDYAIKQAFYDLKYLIDSTSYLPFTRKGTLVLNGDRRIKKGMWIRLKTTGEIFYVNAVQNSFSVGSTIDRLTTLEVSRGLVEKYIFNEHFNYFNVVDIQLNDKFFTARGGGNMSGALTGTKVNRDVLNFFLKKQQFSNV
jgi:hypothetical protein